MRTVLLHEMTRSDFQEYLKRQSDPVAVLALGSVEQHGPHIALGRDCYGALQIAQEVARCTDSVVVHPCWPGISEHHMGFCGTITLEVETLACIIRDVVYSLFRHGVTKAMLVNNHGGNRHSLEYAISLCRRKCGPSIEVMIAPAAESALSKEEKLRRYFDLDIHSGKRETARMLAVHPELVDMERVKGWTPTTVVPGRLRQALGNPAESEFAMLLFSTIQPPTHELTASGIYGFASPNDAVAAEGLAENEHRIAELVRLIGLWREVSREWRKIREV
jgi:creatinine amidohydrolase